jgi:hypothetical protein
MLLNHLSSSATRILDQLAPPTLLRVRDMIEAVAVSKHRAQDRLVDA